MENIDFAFYVRPELFLVSAAVYAFGTLVKKSSIKDKYIPLILGILSFSICLMYFSSTTHLSGIQGALSVLLEATIQGILIAAFAVYANQVVKQLGEKGNS